MYACTVCTYVLRIHVPTYLHTYMYVHMYAYIGVEGLNSLKEELLPPKEDFSFLFAAGLSVQYTIEGNVTEVPSRRKG